MTVCVAQADFDELQELEGQELNKFLGSAVNIFDSMTPEGLKSWREYQRTGSIGSGPPATSTKPAVGAPPVPAGSGALPLTAGDSASTLARAPESKESLAQGASGAAGGGEGASGAGGAAKSGSGGAGSGAGAGGSAPARGQGSKAKSKAMVDFDALAADPDWIEMTDDRAKKRVFYNVVTRKTVRER